jgi:hypothetical protein
MSSDKFILLHVGKEDGKELLKDAIDVQKAERGLFFKGGLNKLICNYFSTMKKQGYYPVGMIINPDTDNVEFLFNRHPEQKEEMKFREFQFQDPYEL